MIPKKGMSLGSFIYQDHRLVMTVAMEKAFHVLTLPILELGDWLEKEIEKNPLLTLTRPSSTPLDLFPIQSKPTLYESLSHQIELYFDLPEEKAIAKKMAGSLDEKGFLTLSSEEIKGKETILKQFQRMDCLGLGARNVQECLLIQLESKKTSPIYQVIAFHYEDLLHNRLEKIAKKLHLSTLELKHLIDKDLRPLNPFPGRQFQQDLNAPLVPDVSILKEGERWTIRVRECDLPTFEIDETYLNRLKESMSTPEEKQFIRHHLTASSWLIETVSRRAKILHEIAIYLLKKQQKYLEKRDHHLVPMTMKEVAHALTLSESTISRAISHKMIETPQGIMMLRAFFTYPIKSKGGNVSNQQAKQVLIQLIKQEKEPLSDAVLSEKMKEQGIVCARRTVAKYRKQLKITFASQRNRWKDLK